MPVFRKSGGFGGGNRGGFRGDSRGSGFGGGSKFGRGGGMDRRDGERPEMFSATCANCGKPCEVPFRPNGSRPVYCKDCFGKMRGDAPRDDRRDDRGPRREDSRSFERRDSAPSFSGSSTPKPQMEDKRFGELSQRLDAIHEKLNAITVIVQGLSGIKAKEAVKDAVNEAMQTEPVKAEKKVAKKKTAKK